MLRKAYWFLAALVCLAVGLYSQSIYTSFHNNIWTATPYDLSRPQEVTSWLIYSATMFIGVALCVKGLYLFPLARTLALGWLAAAMLSITGYALQGAAFYADLGFVNITKGVFSRDMLWQHAIIATIVASMALLIERHVSPPMFSFNLARSHVRRVA